MLIASRFSHTTRKSASYLVRHTQTAFASASHRARIEPRIAKSNASRNASPSMLSSNRVIKGLVTKIRQFLRREIRLQCIEGFIHKHLDKALKLTPHHQQ